MSKCSGSDVILDQPHLERVHADPIHDSQFA